MNFEEVLKFASSQGASDVHLQAGSSPQLRINGLIRNLESPPIQAEPLRQFIASIAPTAITESLDGALPRGARFSKSFDGLGRFRCGLYSHRGQPALVMHPVPAKAATLEELQLPATLREIAQVRRGLTVVSGPSNSGKSATLAALIEIVNDGAHCKIVTLEAPVEILFQPRKALIAQREIGTDVASSAEGIEQAIDQDADLIVVGEIKDSTTLRAVLRAAETGHQVFATMLNSNSSQVLERLLSMAPAEERRLMTTQLADALTAVIAQKLASTKDGKRRAVVEILRGGQYTTRCILEGRWTDLSNYLASRQSGMQQLEQHLLELYQQGVISGTEAMKLATNPETVAEGLRVMRRTTTPTTEAG